MKKAVFLAAVALCAASSQAYDNGEAIDPAVLARIQPDAGKVTVVDFFAAWCVSCRKELPLLSALSGKLDGKQVEFVGVDTDDTAAAAVAFQKELRDKGALNFRTIDDTDQGLVRKFKPRGYPALYILKDGKVMRAHLGAQAGVDTLVADDLSALGVH
ncbi:MAG TPA: TlpA disulfide reductase family protein [Burkholderiaceae bacterium]|jgi:thiol-disulfide isomerase/thioredoxin|nr:TlpA disulfide reductase family protein [Burkholderiaceae bacterium]